MRGGGGRESVMNLSLVATVLLRGEESLHVGENVVEGFFQDVVSAVRKRVRLGFGEPAGPLLEDAAVEHEVLLPPQEKYAVDIADNYILQFLSIGFWRFEPK